MDISNGKMEKHYQNESNEYFWGTSCAKSYRPHKEIEGESSLFNGSNVFAWWSRKNCFIKN
ncbi:hypothetical protein T190130A13A_40032 [Tenacibaculum sp. 190130A14a]|uniref:Uncharacterized protein n=1 Tax=Tenacibaculum polynesiense TaxID=3137857 RepID=A0ABM9PCT8_9FLAO